MDEYIKRSDAIKAYKISYSKDKHRTVEGSLVHEQEHRHILYILDKLPAADVVEVVRCKDCKHQGISGLCQAEGQELTIAKDNHFCSKGERRDA